MLRVGDRIKLKNYPSNYNLEGLEGTIAYIDYSFGTNHYECDMSNGQRMHLLDHQIEALPSIGIQGNSGQKTEIPTGITTLEGAIRHEMKQKRKKWDSLAESWLKEGRCPQCGELGHYHLSTPICKKHGPY